MQASSLLKKFDKKLGKQKREKDKKVKEKKRLQLPELNKR